MTTVKQPNPKPIFVLLYYKFVQVPNPEFEAQQHKLVCKGLGIMGRILIAEEGINGTVAGTKAQLKDYVRYMNAHPQFNDIVFKWSPAPRMPFHKLIVKKRDEIVTLGREVDMSKNSYIKPEELHELFESGKQVTLVDMRNDYEYKVGRFKDAIQPETDKFYELPEKVKQMNLPEDPDAPIVPYCTGGIRCEKAAPLLQEMGYKNVKQLEGGIVKYLEQFPDGYFEGKNFVFDDRLTQKIDTPAGQKVLAECEHCGTPSDHYIDCTKPDCHQLFICCEDCEAKHEGMCPEAVSKLQKA